MKSMVLHFDDGASRPVDGVDQSWTKAEALRAVESANEKIRRIVQKVRRMPGVETATAPIIVRVEWIGEWKHEG